MAKKIKNKQTKHRVMSFNIIARAFCVFVYGEDEDDLSALIEGFGIESLNET